MSDTIAQRRFDVAKERYVIGKIDVPQVAEIPASLNGLDDYSISAEGSGPSSVPPFPLYRALKWEERWSNRYQFAVRCQLRPTVTDLSEWPYGSESIPCPDKPGIFVNPWNDESITIAGPGCGRFWIMYTFGDYLLPRIEKSLDILDRRLVFVANETFDIAFTQACGFMAD